MTEFDPDKFDEKYVHYFDELEQAYSNAYQQLHGEYDAAVLRAIDRNVLSESEPVYEGGDRFRVELPDDVEDRARSLPGDPDQFDAVLEAFVEGIERELQRQFEFDEESS